MWEVVCGGHDARSGVAGSALLSDVKDLLNGLLEAQEVVVYQPCRHKTPSDVKHFKVPCPVETLTKDHPDERPTLF